MYIPRLHTEGVLQTNSIFRPIKRTTKREESTHISDIDKCILDFVNFNGLLALRCTSIRALEQLRPLIFYRYNSGQGKTMWYYMATEFFKRKNDPNLIGSLNLLRLVKYGRLDDCGPVFKTIEIKHFPNLTSLVATTQRNEFLQECSHLQTSLKSLELNLFKIDLSLLTRFTSLETLTLTSVSTIENSSVSLKIKNLTLDSCDNIRLLPSIENLTSLKINKCPKLVTSDIKFSSLKTLSISPCDNLLFLKNLTNLEKLELGLHKSQNFGALKYLTNLQELMIFSSGNSPQNFDLNEIDGLNVYKLTLNDVDFSSYESLTSFKNLKSLSILQSNLDYSFLSGMTLLENLKLSIVDANKLTLNSHRVNPLDYLINLTSLQKLQIGIYKDFDVLKTIKFLNLYRLKITTSNPAPNNILKYFENLEYPPTVHFNDRELNIEKIILRKIAMRQKENSLDSNETCTIN